MKRFWATLVGLILALATAQGLSDGTELLIFDPSHEVILGHGVVKGGRLELELSQDAGELVIVFIGPDGSFETFRGRADEAGDLRIIGVGGTAVNFEELLERADLVAVIRRIKAPAAGGKGAAQEDGRPATRIEEADEKIDKEDDGGEKGKEKGNKDARDGLRGHGI